MAIDLQQFDSVENYRGADLVYCVRKTGGLKFDRQDEALAVLRAAEAQGYRFGFINRRPWGVYLIDLEVSQ